MLPQTVIPEFRDIRVFERRRLIFFGWWNLKHLLDHWEKEKYNDSKDSARIRKLFREIGKKPTIARINLVASHYENPTFQLGFDHSKTPIPVDQASKDRKPTATTFNCCGWCKYCITPMSTHSNCKTTGWCSITHDPVRFDTPCILAKTNQKTLNHCIRCMKKSLRILKNRKVKAARSIKYITEAMQEARIKPPFASWRPLNYFHIGQNVMYFLPSREFIAARITEISDGTITLYSQQTECQYYEFITHPEIITQWGYKYLVRHPYYRQLWIKVSRTPQIADAFIDP